jgi:hypothetical protein
MMERPVQRLIAVLVVLGLAAPGTTLLARTPASVTGVVVSAGDRAPLPGARVYAGDPASGRIVPSAATDEAGRFTIADLDAGRYELAVGVADGLYPVRTPLRLRAGESRSLTLAIEARSGQTPDSGDDPPGEPDAAPAPPEAGAQPHQRHATIWSNPLTAALIVLGSAVVIGVLVEDATDDDDEVPASPFD